MLYANLSRPQNLETYARGMRRCTRRKLSAWLVSVLFCLPRLCSAETADRGLADLSLEDLARLPVTSVSKKPEPLADAAASVYVISNDDIRRSGARNLPEALRLAPNLEVAQAGTDSWAISARGANATSADKLLILIDGRIIYTPLFSGTFWDVQNVLLQDVDRIEVISGPGGTLWGTNAVNGVINIITRKTEDSQGTLAGAGAGRRGADAAVRYGGQLEGGGSYRVYGMMLDNYKSNDTAGMTLSDAMNLAQAGFRSDWSGADRQFTLQGDAYAGNEDQLTLPGRSRVSGLNLLSHWDDKLAGGSDLSLLAYYDRTNRYAPHDFGERLDIGDVELQQTLPETRSQNFVWGASYRYAMDDIQNLPGSTLAFYPAQVSQAWASLFAQDEAVLSQELRLTLGARLEHNPYTGSEFLPNLRLAWKASPNSLLWTAVSRAVRSPSRLDVNLYAPEQPPFLLVGNPDFQSETARVYELGWRAQPSEQWSYSVTAYHNDYSHLRTINLMPPATLTFGNDMTGSETGIETWATYQPLSNWRLSAGLSALRESRTLSGAAMPTSIPTEGDDAPSQWMLRSSYDLSEGEQLDVDVRRVASLPSPYVPAYTVADVRIGWNLTPALECSVLAQNLFGPAHVEFGDPKTTASEFGRGLYVRLTWRPGQE